MSLPVRTKTVTINGQVVGTELSAADMRLWSLVFCFDRKPGKFLFRAPVEAFDRLFDYKWTIHADTILFLRKQLRELYGHHAPEWCVVRDLDEIVNGKL
jgi:hypothetical protein